MQLISAVTVGAGGAANITFSGIPGSYTDLVLLVSGRTAVAANSDELVLRFNSDTGANYSWRTLNSTGTASDTFGATGATAFRGGSFSGSSNITPMFSNFMIYLPNYIQTSVKPIYADTLLGTNNSITTGLMQIASGSYSGGSGITSISLAGNSGQNFAQHSTAYLYGIVKGAGGATVS
jgi:hypothetical protein